jgi:hypothetical protein
MLEALDEVMERHACAWWYCTICEVFDLRFKIPRGRPSIWKALGGDGFIFNIYFLILDDEVSSMMGMGEGKKNIPSAKQGRVLMERVRTLAQAKLKRMSCHERGILVVLKE